ncbi:hypothetical protein [Micromonospora avicenniae]|uniref:Uncharacterized protein n=1 Tax=Micromonospora avicenniae TaxID=1198245 RepID=A0A1N7F6P3_9ACTN|nr:hypothetical protein [Micromonospora avicenniae]SIR95993.1 hypothetical protein SAMN05444858_13116 [Micromonospora avicenniae]
MDPRALFISLAVGTVATWATGKIMKELRIPAYAAPLVGAAATMVVNTAAKLLR